MAADVRDPAQPGRAGRERGEGGDVGVSSPTSCRSTSTPARMSGPADGQPGRPGHDRRADCSSTAGSRRPAGWCARGQPATVTSPPVTAAAARNGAALDRSGSTASPGPDRAGRDPPDVGLGVVDLHAGGAQHVHGHLDVRQRRHRRADVDAPSRPLVAGARQQQPGDELGRRRRVDHDLAAGQAPVPCTVNGSRSPSIRRRARAARRAPCPSAAPGRAGRRRSSPGRRPARRPAARSASRCRPARSRTDAAAAQAVVRARPPRARRRGRSGRRARAARRPSARCPGWAGRRDASPGRRRARRAAARGWSPTSSRARRPGRGPGRRRRGRARAVLTSGPASRPSSTRLQACRRPSASGTRGRRPGPATAGCAGAVAPGEGVPRWTHVRSLRLDQGPRRPGRRVPGGGRHRRCGARGLQRRADQADRHGGPAAPARRRRQPGPGPRGTHPAAGPLGSGAVLGEGRRAARA